MLIAFEGPDNTGKTTSADILASSGQSVHEAHKGDYLRVRDEIAGEHLVGTFDRISWFGHMVYRLALPEHDWHDDKVRVVYAMPDTHLVIKLHRPDLAQHISDELYSNGTLARVNPMYWYFADFFLNLNVQQEFTLFKTVSVIEVANDPRDGSFSQRLVRFSSPVTPQYEAILSGHVTDDGSLLDFLNYEDSQRI